MSKNAGTSSRRKSTSSSAESGFDAHSTSTAREVAARVLVRVWQDAAYAAPTLDAELRHTSLAPRDVRLATELVYGVLRTRGALERRLDAHAKRQGYKRKPAVLAPLLIGAYSIGFLERIPVHAAVDEAVRAIRAASDRRVAGFANAVLRKLAKEQAQGGRSDLDRAIVEATPSWLRQAIRKSVGDDGLVALVTASDAALGQGLCVRDAGARPAWIDRLREARPAASITAGQASPHCIRLHAAGNLRSLPGVGSDWIAQEEGAQVVALSVGARPGESILDGCAGRGGKSFLLTARVGSEGAVDAADRSPAKLKRLRAATPHGARVRHTYAVDWSRGVGEAPSDYDRALVDAPCSGVGTLRRRPEIAGRLGAGDPARLAAVQIELVRAVATRVRSGGRLVYAVCSVLAAETDDVVAALSRSAPGDEPGAAELEPSPFDDGIVAELAGGSSSLRLLPGIHGTDGYFMAGFRVHRR